MKIERDERGTSESASRRRSSTETSRKRKTTDLLTPVSEELQPVSRRGRKRSGTTRRLASERRGAVSERRETHSTNSARFIAEALEQHHKRTGRQTAQKPAPEGPGWPFRIGLILAAVGILVFMAAFIFSDQRPPPPPPLPVAKGRSPRKAGPQRGPKIEPAGAEWASAGSRSGSRSPEAAPRLPRRRVLQVAGRVLEEGGYGVPGARIRLLATTVGGSLRSVGQTIRSGKEGAFSLTGSDEAILLEVKATGFATRIVPLSGQEAVGLAALEIILMEAKAIDGVVVAAESGEPIAGARIRGESASWRGEQQSAADGRFLFDDVPSESVNLFVSAEGRVPAVADGRSGVTVALLRGRSVRGIIVDKAQVPVPGADVVVLGSEHPSLPRRTRSDRDGRFLVKGIGPNEEVMVLARTNMLATPNREDWQPADRSSLRIQVLPMARALVVGESDKSLRLAPGMSLGVGTSEIAGRVTPEGVIFEGLPAGSYRVLRGRVEVGDRVELQAGRTARIRLPDEGELVDPPREGEASAGPAQALEDGGEVDIRVLDERDRPLTSASVFVDSGLSGQSLYRTKTDSSGRARVPRVSTRMLITAEFPGRMLKRAVEVGPSSAQVTLMLLRPARLVGEVRPSTATSVTLIDIEQGQPVREIVTGEDGRFRFEDLVPGDYFLEFQADGFQVGKRKVTLPVIGDYLRLDMTPGGEEHALPENLRDLKDPERDPEEGKG